MSHQLDIAYIQRTLRTERIGRRIECLPETTSTNDVAWSLVDRDAGSDGGDGLVIFCEHQTAGRGRLGRSWKAPRGAGLLCSIVVNDSDGAFRGDELVLLCAVATCDAVAKATSVSARIKWPNDLVVHGRKLAGILIESKTIGDSGRTFVCGIGINCLQQRGHLAGELAATATSLDIESARPVNRNDVAVALLTEFDARLREAHAGDRETLRRAWLDRCEPLGRPIRLLCRGEVCSGTTVDIDPTAALVIQLDSGHRRAFPAADTTILDASGH